MRVLANVWNPRKSLQIVVFVISSYKNITKSFCINLLIWLWSRLRCGAGKGEEDSKGWEVRRTKGEEKREARSGEEGGRGSVEEVSDLHILCCLDIGRLELN